MTNSTATRIPRLGARLWADDTPMAWEGGLAKTREFVLEIADAPAAPAIAPLLGILPPVWACGSEAAGALLPRNAEALRQLGYWEAWRETAMRQWVNAMPTGLRDCGDACMGGPYKGKNAFLNLEYDVPLNFLHQFLRTGQRWCLDAAAAMVRHQADVDTENVAGFAWKHSPLHTTTEAEFGHVFLRNLPLHHWLTGDPRDRETTTAETHAWRFPAFAARYHLLPQFAHDPGDLPRAEDWQALRFKSREVDLYLRPRGITDVPIAIAREGLAHGQAELFDPAGRLLGRVGLDDPNRLLQTATLALPTGAPWLRLRLSSPDAFAWQVQHDRRAAAVVADPRGEQLPFLLPRAVGALVEGASEVTLRFEVIGEGFHSATLFDPRGAPVRRVRRFVDFEDPDEVTGSLPQKQNNALLASLWADAQTR